MLGRAAALRSPFRACEKLIEVLDLAMDHIGRFERHKSPTASQGSEVRIFIGHGRSPVWRELKDFIDSRLKLPWEEFNREPAAGKTTVARLSEMLDAASFAFLVMTAEDEQKDGRLRPRMNVIHEAGLFQGRLGFSKAIILIEDGCEEFSNIHGLTQIPFPTGRISACFEEIRRVLEREGLLPS
jgi:predicted nucleotide-binding protein